METLEQWVDRQYQRSAIGMQKSISPLKVIKARPGFAQTIVPKRGSVVASPVPASYDPDPDYFFHWYRDSAVTVDALRLLAQDGSVGESALEQFADFVRFSLSLEGLNGRILVQEPAWRGRVAPDFVKFLRDDADLDAAHGDRIAAETRVNADGSLDISSWPRPQNDGPPMRALSLMRWSRHVDFKPDVDAAMSALLRADLTFARRHWNGPCFDIWEEEKGRHYYALRLSAAALEEGEAWLTRRGFAEEARACRDAAQAILPVLDSFWLPGDGYYRSRILESGVRSTKELDISVILAAIHADGKGGSECGADPRMLATLSRLEALFDSEYAINQGRTRGRGPAMGRYLGDVYYSGGAYYFSTLGAAEFCFRAALHGDDAASFIERGDAYLETVRTFTPDHGELSEQFDKTTGVQTSAKQLAWSYAAFISCVVARRSALQRHPRRAP